MPGSHLFRFELSLPRYLRGSRPRIRIVAPNIGGSCNFIASPAAARQCGPPRKRSQRTERPKVSVWAFGYTRYLTALDDPFGVVAGTRNFARASTCAILVRTR